MKSQKAYAPANISLIFKVVTGGSLGVGFTVDKGVTAEVSPAKKTEIFFNGKPITLPTVASVINQPFKIYLQSKLPLGAGFGLSGASAFATALATHKKSRLDCAKIAHKAEIKNKTGLGDVVNQYFGGFLVKRVSSAKFKVEHLPLGGTPLYCISYGKLLTSTVLAKNYSRINRAADKALRKIIPELSFSEVLSIAKKFALESGLLTSKKIITCIDSIEKHGGHATMIMLGEGVVSDTLFPGSIKLTVSERVLE